MIFLFYFWQGKKGLRIMVSWSILYETAMPFLPNELLN